VSHAVIHNKGTVGILGLLVTHGRWGKTTLMEFQWRLHVRPSWCYTTVPLLFQRVAMYVTSPLFGCPAYFLSFFTDTREKYVIKFGLV